MLYSHLIIHALSSLWCDYEKSCRHSAAHVKGETHEVYSDLTKSGIKASQIDGIRTGLDELEIKFDILRVVGVEMHLRLFLILYGPSTTEEMAVFEF